MRSRRAGHIPEQRPWQRAVAEPSRLAVYLLELLLIAGGYVLLGWVGHRLRLDGRVLVFWPAAGFAVAALLVRGTSRWPAILLGSVMVAWRWVLSAGALETEVPGALVALLTGVSRALSTVVSVWLYHAVAGPARWPHSTRGVILATLMLGLVAPALAAVTGQAALWLGGIGEAGLGFAGEVWLWFVANSTGLVVVAPLFLVFAEPRVGGPRLARWELPAALLAFAAMGGASFLMLRVTGTAMPMAYPVFPLVVWACLRLGSRGAALTNLLWAVVFVSSTLLQPGLPELPQVFLSLHARLALLSAVFLVLAAAFEERFRLQQALEAERVSLERRVGTRTQELAGSLSLLHSSLESTADGLLVVNREGRIVLANQRFLELWRIPPEILVSGEDERALAYVQDQLVFPADFLARVEHLYRHPELESEDEVLLRDGRVFERFSRPQLLGDERVGRVWSFRDVTQRRHAEAERNRLLVEEARARRSAERAAREAREALALREEFLQVAAHEMKTPLTSLKMQLQRLTQALTGAPGSSVQTGLITPRVSSALRSLRRLQELGDQLLDGTQLGVEALALRYAPLDFRAVVAEHLEEYREHAARIHSELRLEPGEGLPGECDRFRLTQIVHCLVSNALKFGAGAAVSVQLEADAERVWLRVQDHGIGIAPEDQARILERFVRAVDARHYGGLGLGLWLARRSAEALGGHISVQSALGRGATFTVELPRRRPRPPAGVESPAAGPGGSAT